MINRGRRRRINGGGGNGGKINGKTNKDNVSMTINIKPLHSNIIEFASSNYFLWTDEFGAKYYHSKVKHM